MMWIIITGSITAGFEFTGPFATREAAFAFGDANKDKIAEFDVVELRPEYPCY